MGYQAPMHRFRRVLWTLVALIFLGLSWLWDHLHPIITFLIRLIPLEGVKEAVRRFMEHLPPYPTLVVFLIPAIVHELMKVGAFFLFHRHQWLAGVAHLCRGRCPRHRARRLPLRDLQGEIAFDPLVCLVLRLVRKGPSLGACANRPHQGVYPSGAGRGRPRRTSRRHHRQARGAVALRAATAPGSHRCLSRRLSLFPRLASLSPGVTARSTTVSFPASRPARARGEGKPFPNAFWASQRFLGPLPSARFAHLAGGDTRGYNRVIPGLAPCKGARGRETISQRFLGFTALSGPPSLGSLRSPRRG